jgi:hypothetical protein
LDVIRCSQFNRSGGYGTRHVGRCCGGRGEATCAGFCPHPARWSGTHMRAALWCASLTLGVPNAVPADFAGSTLSGPLRRDRVLPLGWLTNTAAARCPVPAPPPGWLRLPCRSEPGPWWGSARTRDGASRKAAVLVPFLPGPSLHPAVARAPRHELYGGARATRRHLSRLPG